MMQYANVDGVKTTPMKGLRGVCPGCGKQVTAKCGMINIHHWSHLQRTDCDPWWEPMTPWHIDWQDQFAEDWREVILRDIHTGEFHRADIYTPNEVTIEFQYSSISSEEMECRNQFYSKLIWVVNGIRFKENFRFVGKIPNPNSPLFAEYEFQIEPKPYIGLGYLTKKTDWETYNLRGTKYKLDTPEMAAFKTSHEKIEHIHWQFDWTHQHKRWMNCAAPVFIDFGGEVLYWLRKRRQTFTTFCYLQEVKKVDFLAKYGGSSLGSAEMNNT
jgi:competence CoiA-like predicted nuclease